MNQPNFFIVGAPKCGTTALSDYLREHPQVFVSEPKEPHFFATDFEKYRITKTPAQYQQLFDSRNESAVGEASVFYLYSTEAIPNILRYRPDAKIIVMVRKPQEAIYSFHSQLLYTADEEETDFVTAWRLQSDRAQGRHIPKLCREPALLQYAEVGFFGKQVARLYEIFPKQQIEVILFDDFVQHTKETYERVIQFLEVESDRREDFAVINSNKVHKSRFVGQFAAKPPESLTAVALKAKKILGIEELGIISTLKKFNTQKSKRDPLKPAFKEELTATFQEDIELLGNTIQRDLSHWLT